MSKITPTDVSVRFFDASDIIDLADYFYESPKRFIESLGINLKALGEKSEFIKNYQNHLEMLKTKKLKPNAVTVFYKKEKIGVHTATHLLPNESLTIHAHFFNTEFRGKGIGTISGLKACELFFNEFKLKEILIKIPLNNIAPLKVAEKLGLVSDEVEVLDWPQLIGPMKAQVFRIKHAQMKELKDRVGIE